jgi:hypothetical protein
VKSADSNLSARPAVKPQGYPYKILWIDCLRRLLMGKNREMDLQYFESIFTIQALIAQKLR